MSHKNHQPLTQDEQEDQILLIQSCSDRKKDGSAREPAIDIYDGYFFRIIKKAERDGRIDGRIEIQILSAKYGLLDPKDTIQPYDQRMSPQRAKELQPSLLSEVSGIVVSRDIKAIVLNLGQDYLKAIEPLKSDLSIPVYVINGEGIGEKGQKLKSFLEAPVQEALTPLE